jgi:type II secretory pathway component PulJ
MLTSRNRCTGRSARMRGLSLVELMVGIAVGLFIVAAATLLTSTQLSDNRRLLIETQVQQDLRATMDMIVRDTRRSGGWDEAYKTVPAPTAPSIVANPFDYVVLPTSATAGPLYYNYGRSAGVASFGFQLSEGVLKGCVGALVAAGCDEGWQDISDGNTLVITEFKVDAVRTSHTGNIQPMRMACPNLCDPDPTSAAATACWPKVEMQELMFTIKGHSKSEPTIERTLSSSVRLRNLKLTVDGAVPAGQACPPSP